MKKVTMVLGPSASGKTTFVKRKFLEGKEFVNVSKPVKHCISGSTLLIGHYNIGKSCEGADTLPFNALYKVIDFLKEAHPLFEELVVEGERLTSRPFLNFLKELGCPVEVFLLDCTPEQTAERKRARGEFWKGNNNFSMSFIKTTRTKYVALRSSDAIYGLPYNMVWLEQFQEKELISVLAIVHDSIMEARTRQQCRGGLCAN